MTFGPANLASRLQVFQQSNGAPARFVIAFSGGLDSTVLAHALAALAANNPIFADTPVLAIHVDHQLQADSGQWSEHCEQTAAELGIEFRLLAVDVDLSSGKGPEAAAREARYAALSAELAEGDWLLSAHHREDQSETLLLNLIRGSGPAGLAGIGKARRFGPGWLLRPLLEWSKSDLERYASDNDLRWVEDPSNGEQRFDRNFLRHEVLPRLQERWPDVAGNLARSAAHAGEAATLLQELASIDLAALDSDGTRIPIDALSALSESRQRNLLRHALRSLGLPVPTASLLQRVLEEVMPAREDAQPLVTWPGAAVRRYRNRLYLLAEEAFSGIETLPVRDSRVDLGAGLGELEFVRDAEIGISESLFDDELIIQPRIGGEKFIPQGQSHTRELKKLLQERGVVPWMRDRLPLLYCGEQLLAVGDLWIAADAVAKPGVAVRWHRRPALH